MPSQKPKYTAQQIASLLSLHVATVIHHAQRMGVGTQMRPKHPWYFSEADLEKLRKRNTQPGNPNLIKHGRLTAQ